jgi:endonuclease III
MNYECIYRLLAQRGKELVARPREFTTFADIQEADNLLNNLESYPHAFVLACLMDRRQPAERCWVIPYRFKEKLNTFDIHALTSLSPNDVLQLMMEPQPLHRHPEIMADIFYCGIQDIQSKYYKDASNIWNDNPSSATLVKRFLEFKGVGQKISTMAANILVRDFKIPVKDKFSIDVSVDRQVRKVFFRLGLIPKNASSEIVIYTAREINPEYPGVIDLATWEIGRNWCRPKNPNCINCIMNKCCPTAKEVM